MVLYSYDINAIMIECMKNRCEAEMERVFATVHSKLEKRGIKPKINIMDNEASVSIEQWLAR